ncbi:hypothetical protein PIB30_115477, partial [Stylosanthes scabra]|nr:hypothetical protein [Stylosanthes scabra]
YGSIVQSSSLQQCGLQATTSEQYVTIEIPQDLIREYLAQNYTHLHLGAVRLHWGNRTVLPKVRP